MYTYVSGHFVRAPCDARGGDLWQTCEYMNAKKECARWLPAAAAAAAATATVTAAAGAAGTPRGAAAAPAARRPTA